MIEWCIQNPVPSVIGVGIFFVIALLLLQGMEIIQKLIPERQTKPVPQPQPERAPEPQAAPKRKSRD